MGYTKEELGKRLVPGALVRLGEQYKSVSPWHYNTEIIRLVNVGNRTGFCFGVNNTGFNDIYGLFGEDLSGFMDCQVIQGDVFVPFDLNEQKQDDRIPDPVSVPVCDDLSYAGIEKLVQGDAFIGSALIDSMVFKRDQYLEDIERVEKELEDAKRQIEELEQGCRHVASHLGKKLPLTVCRPGYVIFVAGGEIVVDKNVL